MPSPFYKSTGALSHRNRSAFMKFADFVRKYLAPQSPLIAAVVLALSFQTSPAATTPVVGDAAPNFTLNTLEDKPVDLKQLTAKKPVVLVVLRGWPGYQCPICTRQVQDFARKAADFAARGAQVVMVYPGPAADLKAHAAEFLQNKEWPRDFLFVIDPDYTFTSAYGLRWDAKNETAYPSTFIIAPDNKVRFAHISKQHGDRVDSAAALKALADVQ